jgi:hypothetical protein
MWHATFDVVLFWVKEEIKMVAPLAMILVPLESPQ